MSPAKINCIVVLLTFFFTISRSEDSVDRPSVSLKDGTNVLGVFKEYHSDDLPAHGKVEAFYGIPYAKPPIGTLRFKPPVPYGQLDSAFDAAEVGNSCIQVDPNTTEFFLTNNEMSEDCLFLDVIVPHPKPNKAPVFFMIHGGAFIVGAGNMKYGSPIPAVVYGDIIAVTINYRLGLFGFSSTGDDVIPGNMGLMDQQVALKWVNENIEAFGGDPSSITIGGISAGASSVGFHVLSPGSRGLFKYGIMESGSPFDVWNGFRSIEVTIAETKDLARALECSKDEIEDNQKRLECLQRGTGDELFEKFNTISDMKHQPGPVVDGTFLQGTPEKVIERGILNGEGLIIGTNADEGTLIALGIFTDKEVTPIINDTMMGALVSFMGTAMNEPIILDLIKTIYTSDPGNLVEDTEEEHDFFHETTQFLGDGFFMCSESRFARLMPFPVFRYTMTYVPSENFMGVKWAGSAHGDEAQYTWGMVFDDDSTATNEEKDMSRAAMNYWLNFIKTGNPSGDERARDDVTLPEWRRFTKEDEVFKDLTPEMSDRYMKKRECYFHDNILPPLREALDELKKLRDERDERSKWTDDGQCEGESCDHSEAQSEGKP